MADYAIQWDGKTVEFPPAGPINPDGVSWARIRDDDGNGVYVNLSATYAIGLSDRRHRTTIPGGKGFSPRAASA